MRESWRKVRIALGVAGLAARRLRGERRPFILNHLVTVRCNVACPFCYVSGPEQQAYNRERYGKRGELDSEELRDFYRQLVAAGFRLNVVVGGEPLLRTDLGAALEELRGHLYIALFTNGLLLEERHELVAAATTLFVSIDAPDAQHDVLRGRKGCLEKALAGIEAVRRHHPGVRVAINTTLSADNVHRAGEMLRLARELDLPIAFQPPSYGGQFALEDRPTAESEQATPAAGAVAEAFARIREAAHNGSRVIGSDEFFSHVVEDRPAYSCCYPAYTLGPVLPNGDVVGCTSSRVIGNLRRTSVEDLIASEPFRANAARGPRCPIGCRDWGIFDLAAIADRRVGGEDLRRLAHALA